MNIAKQLRNKNIAEYLLYMWQTEDILRANHCDIDQLRKNVIAQFPASEQRNRNGGTTTWPT